MLLVLFFCSKQFILDNVFYYVVCRLFLRLFLLVTIFFFVIFHFAIIEYLLVILVFVVILFFFPYYIPKVFLDMSCFVTEMKFCYVCTFFMTEVFFIVTISIASRAGILVLVFSCRGIFHFLLKFLVLIVCSFGQISPKYCHESSQQLECHIYHLFFLLGFQRWFVIFQVSLIVYES